MGRIILPGSHNTLNMSHKIGMEGFYRLQSRKAKSGTLRADTGWFHNLITDRGLWLQHAMPVFGLTGTGSIAANCAVGTGNTTPAVSDTALSALRATVLAPQQGGGGYVATQGYVAAASPLPAYWYIRYIYTFSTGAAAGNLAEVGAYPGSANVNGDMFSRSLVVDAGGNPTTITVLSDEILTVTYELRYYLDPTDHSFSVNLNGSPLTGVYRLMSMTSAPIGTDAIIDKSNYAVQICTGDLGPVTGNPTGAIGNINITTSGLVGVTNDIVNSGTVYADWKGTFGTGNGTGTIKSITFAGHMWKYQFGNLSTPIVKNAGQQLQCNFRTIWGRF